MPVNPLSICRLLLNLYRLLLRDLNPEMRTREFTGLEQLDSGLTFARVGTHYQCCRSKLLVGILGCGLCRGSSLPRRRLDFRAVAKAER